LGRGEILPPDLLSLQQAFEQASLKGLHSGLKVVHFPDVNINVNKQPLASVHTTLPPPPGRRTSGTAPCSTDDLDWPPPPGRRTSGTAPCATDEDLD
jgi:hypothetical protein